MYGSRSCGATARLAEVVLLGILPAAGGVALVVARQYLRVLVLPFDAARFQYARAVQAGLLPNSILASRDLEIALDALEQLTLGALARRV